MQVILRENVKSLGKVGDSVKVKDGYAKNFLIPNGLAVEADSRNIKMLVHEKRKIHEAAKK
ncbi:MAG: 50S ribosomal protein L9, partial [Nitrospirae bacterium]|nr:50S ribosomal protein L9 [Nitrospirota bacterium]